MRYVNVIDWHVVPFRTDQFIDTWTPVAERVMAFGARGWSLTRNGDDTLHFRQTSVWDDKDDFYDYWHGTEIMEARERAMSWYHKPVLPEWHLIVGANEASAMIDTSG
ncbi:MAG: hypothetical protein ACR2NA_08700 [Solirubrobacterales bacterium]